MKLWVTREEDDNSFENITIWETKPLVKTSKKIKHYLPDCKSYHTSCELDAMYILQANRISFKKIFGFTPEKGSCTVVEIETRIASSSKK